MIFEKFVIGIRNKNVRKYMGKRYFFILPLSDISFERITKKLHKIGERSIIKSPLLKFNLTGSTPETRIRPIKDRITPDTLNIPNLSFKIIKERTATKITIRLAITAALFAKVYFWPIYWKKNPPAFVIPSNNIFFSVKTFKFISLFIKGIIKIEAINNDYTNNSNILNIIVNVISVFVVQKYKQGE